MKKHDGWKKTVAFVLSLALVAGAMPANVGGFLTKSVGIVAHAEEQCETLDTNTYQDTYRGKNVTVTPEHSGDGDGFFLSKWVDYENPEDSTENSATITVAKDYKITKLELVRGCYDGTPVISSDTAERTQNGETFIFTNVNASSVTVSCLWDEVCQIKQVKVYYDYSKTDISDATVTLKADNTVASVTVGGDKITDLSEFDITYGTDDSHTATTPPTIIGSYFAYVTAKDTNKDYRGTAKSAEFAVTKSTVKTADEFKAAVNKGGEVQLDADIILPLSESLTFEKNMTLDLNGHTLTVEKAGMYYYLSVDASLTIKDSAGNGKLIHPNSSYVFLVYVGGALYLESGTLEFTNSETDGIDVFRGPFIMKGGTINSAGYSIWRDSSPVTISGGTINGGFYGSDGDLTITGGKFSFDPTEHLDTTRCTAEKDGEYWNVLEYISDATVNLADDFTVISLTIGDKTITDLSGFDVIYAKTDSDITSETVPTKKGTYVAYVTAKDTNKEYKGTAKSAVFTQKNDISGAAVALNADNTVASITIGDETITDLTDFDITYGTDNSHTATTPPTIIGSYFAYVTAKDTNKDYRGTAKSAEFAVTKSTVKTADEFKAAVNKGGEVQLDADIILPLSESLTFEKNMTLDLNGHTLTVEKAGMYYYLSVDASLTIKDSAGNGKLIHPNSSYVFLVYVGGALYLESGTLEFTNSETDGIDVFRGPFIMKGGTINSAGYSIWRDGCPVTISGGTINGGFYESNGDLTITGGNFNFDPSDYIDKNNYHVKEDGDRWLVVANVLDISEATVNLTDDHTVSSITIGGDTITDLSGFDITYGATADTATATFPTAPGSYYAFVTAKTDNENYTGTAKSAEFNIVVTYTEVPAADPTCTTDGNIHYWSGSDGNYYSDNQGTLLTDQNGDNVVDEKDVIIPATGHKWKYSSKTNNTDGSLTVTFACENDAEHTEDIKLTKQNILYISKTTGVMPTWTWANDYSSASLSFGSIPEEKAADFATNLEIDESLALYFAKNGITVPAIVTTGETAPATCTQNGTKTLIAHVNQLTDTKIVDDNEQPATGHKYGSPIWSWSNNGNGYTATMKAVCSKCGEVKTYRANVTSTIADGMITYTATATVDGVDYTSTQQVKESYTLYVDGGTITDGAKESYSYADAVTVTADEQQGGKFFSGWYIGNTRITTKQSYTFYIKSDMTVTAKYEGETVQKEQADVSVMINRSNIADKKQKVVFSLNWALPSGCKLKEAGIVRRYDNAEDLTLENVNGSEIKKNASTLRTQNGNCNINLTVSATTKLKTINAVAYVVYTDKNGGEQTVYSNVQTSAYTN